MAQQLRAAGEQVDFLRFLPARRVDAGGAEIARNWWAATFFAGPGWGASGEELLSTSASALPCANCSESLSPGARAAAVLTALPLTSLMMA